MHVTGSSADRGNVSPVCDLKTKLILSLTLIFVSTPLAYAGLSLTNWVPQLPPANWPKVTIEKNGANGAYAKATVKVELIQAKTVDFIKNEPNYIFGFTAGNQSSGNFRAGTTGIHVIVNLEKGYRVNSWKIDFAKVDSKIGADALARKIADRCEDVAARTQQPNSYDFHAGCILNLTSQKEALGSMKVKVEIGPDERQVKINPDLNADVTSSPDSKGATAECTSTSRYRKCDVTYRKGDLATFTATMKEDYVKVKFWKRFYRRIDGKKGDCENPAYAIANLYYCTIYPVPADELCPGQTSCTIEVGGTPHDRMYVIPEYYVAPQYETFDQGDGGVENLEPQLAMRRLNKARDAALKAIGKMTKQEYDRIYGSIFRAHYFPRQRMQIGGDLFRRYVDMYTSALATTTKDWKGCKYSEDENGHFSDNYLVCSDNDFNRGYTFIYRLVGDNYVREKICPLNRYEVRQADTQGNEITVDEEKKIFEVGYPPSSCMKSYLGRAEFDEVTQEGEALTTFLHLVPFGYTADEINEKGLKGVTIHSVTAAAADAVTLGLPIAGWLRAGATLTKALGTAARVKSSSVVVGFVGKYWNPIQIVGYTIDGADLLVVTEETLEKELLTKDGATIVEKAFVGYRIAATVFPLVVGKRTSIIKERIKEKLPDIRTAKRVLEPELFEPIKISNGANLKCDNIRVVNLTGAQRLGGGYYANVYVHPTKSASAIKVGKVGYNETTAKMYSNTGKQFYEEVGDFGIKHEGISAVRSKDSSVLDCNSFGVVMENFTVTRNAKSLADFGNEGHKLSLAQLRTLQSAQMKMIEKHIYHNDIHPGNLGVTDSKLFVFDTDQVQFLKTEGDIKAFLNRNDFPLDAKVESGLATLYYEDFVKIWKEHGPSSKVPSFADWDTGNF